VSIAFRRWKASFSAKPFAEALAQEVNRLDARAVFVLASGTLARTTDTIDRLRQVLGNRIAGVCAKSVRTHRGPTLWKRLMPRARSAPICSSPWWWLGHRCGQDGRPLPRQWRHRARAARRLPRQDRRRRHDAASTGRVAQCAHDRDSDDFVGRRVLGGRWLHRHGQTRQGSYSHPMMMPRTVILDPDAAVHTRNGCFCRPASVPSTTRSRTSARSTGSRSPRAPPIMRSAAGKGLPAVKADRRTWKRGSIVRSALGCRWSARRPASAREQATASGTC